VRSEGKHLDVFCLPCGYLGELIMRLAAADFKVRTQGRCRDPTEVGKCPLTNGQPALEAGAPVAGIDATSFEPSLGQFLSICDGKPDPLGPRSLFQLCQLGDGRARIAAVRMSSAQSWGRCRSTA